MTDSATAEIPLEIGRTESSRADAGTIQLRIAGRWLDPSSADEEELLVVQIDGRRHRFPGTRDPEPPGSDGWSASFTLPAWAEPRHDGQAALWLGNAVIPVPPARSEHHGESELGRAVAPAPPAPPAQPPPAPAAGAPPAPAAQPPPAPAAGPPPAPAAGPPPYASPEPPRSGPLADLLLKETVAALHDELERRTAELARIRGTLADAQSDLESRGATQAALEATHIELRSQLERLSGAIQSDRDELARRTAELERERQDFGRERESFGRQREELNSRLAELTAGRDAAVTELGRMREAVAAASVARDGAVSEAAGLRAELTRLGTELAATRERVSAESGDLGEAQRLLAEARALADEMGGRAG
jgi:DNA repair exonuclease SbcCD ATPase subunit